MNSQRLRRRDRVFLALTAIGFALLVLSVLPVTADSQTSTRVVTSEAQPFQPECAARVAHGNWSAEMWSGPLAHCAEYWPYDNRPIPPIIVVYPTPTASPAP
jgi:hypothetical protein